MARSLARAQPPSALEPDQARAELVKAADFDREAFELRKHANLRARLIAAEMRNNRRAWTYQEIADLWEIQSYQSVQTALSKVGAIPPELAKLTAEEARDETLEMRKIAERAEALRKAARQRRNEIVDEMVRVREGVPGSWPSINAPARWIGKAGLQLMDDMRAYWRANGHGDYLPPMARLYRETHGTREAVS